LKDDVAEWPLVFVQMPAHPTDAHTRQKELLLKQMAAFFAREEPVPANATRRPKNGRIL
jgi:hypothetical protein